MKFGLSVFRLCNCAQYICMPFKLCSQLFTVHFTCARSRAVPVITWAIYVYRYILSQGKCLVMTMGRGAARNFEMGSWKKEKIIKKIN